MRHIKTFGLAMVTMFALAAVASSSASAACGGNPLPCFHGPYPIHFTALQLGEGELITIGGRDIKCKHGSALGFVNGPKDVLVGGGAASGGIVYKGCKSTKFGAGECQSGATKGEIVTLPLLGLLGYINKTSREVGLLFETDGGGTHFASFECEAFIKEKVTVTGSVICKLSPVNTPTPTKDYHLLCKQTNGIQEPLSFEGQGKMSLTTQGSGLENFTEQSGVTALSDILTLTLSLLLA
jgi:hypothetical protein